MSRSMAVASYPRQERRWSSSDEVEDEDRRRRRRDDFDEYEYYYGSSDRRRDHYRHDDYDEHEYERYRRRQRQRQENEPWSHYQPPPPPPPPSRHAAAAVARHHDDDDYFSARHEPPSRQLARHYHRGDDNTHDHHDENRHREQQQQQHLHHQPQQQQRYSSRHLQQQQLFITPTEDSSLLSGTHGRQRRLERNIRKLDLQRARRYGMREHNNDQVHPPGRLKYTFGGVVFIYDPHTNREVTSFPSHDRALPTSGTSVADPVLLDKILPADPATLQQQHEQDHQRVLEDKESWKSHSVLVVDMSGSMRRDDVSGARCRADGVWMMLARDFVKQQLELKVATVYDVVSVVIMQDDATVLMECEPMDWVLYNKMLDFREWSVLRPSGFGNYMPALKRAELLLDINPLGSCALSLLFFSDGTPSDHGDFCYTMGRIAAKYRRRLTVTCVGMADEDEESFETLMGMVAEADAYGAAASFHKPLFTTDSLSDAMTSLVTSLTKSKTELTDVNRGVARVVRTDVERERNGTPDDLVLTPEWETYRNNSATHYVYRIWKWNHRANNFVMLMDPRCIFCYKMAGRQNCQPDASKGVLCPMCEAAFVCHNCNEQGRFEKSHYKSEECLQWLVDRQQGRILCEPITSFSVAMKKPIFGEGVERIVHKFRFLDDQGNFIGPKMVAKESRFVEGGHGTLEQNKKQKMNYMREFMRTQALASEFARKFNEALDALVEHFAEEAKAWIWRFPRIHFLEPFVVEVSHDDKEFNFLIENMLEGKYEKYNSNMGMVKGQAGNVPRSELHRLCNEISAVRLGAIREEDSAMQDDDEEEEEEEDLDHDGGTGADKIMNRKKSIPIHGEYGDVRDEDFPQAFSHFTYEKSHKRLMVVDLQGVFSVHTDGTREFRLTDPVIHKRRDQGGKHPPLMKKWNFGRTDRGEKGMSAFWATHKCTDACRLLGLKEHKN